MEEKRFFELNSSNIPNMFYTTTSIYQLLSLILVK